MSAGERNSARIGQRDAVSAGESRGSGVALPGFAEDGRTVIIALDHALASGQVPPLDQPGPLLERVLAGDPDGLILSAGVSRLYRGSGGSTRPAAGRPPWWLTADYFATSVVPGASGEAELHTRIWDAATARSLGAAGLKCLLVFGRVDARVQLANVESVTRLVAEARPLGLAVMVEATLWGGRIPAHRQHDPELIAHAARVAFELGADVIKIPLPEGGVGLAELSSALPVPIVAMGGPAREPARLFAALAEAVSAGVRGVALGRNAWQHPEPAAYVAALRALVHDRLPAAAALAQLQDRAEPRPAARRSA